MQRLHVLDGEARSPSGEDHRESQFSTHFVQSQGRFLYHPAVVRLLRALHRQRQVLLRHSGVQVHRAMVRRAGEGRRLLLLLLLLLLHGRVELLLLQLMVEMLMLRRCRATKWLVPVGDLGRLLRGEFA